MLHPNYEVVFLKLGVKSCCLCQLGIVTGINENRQLQMFAFCIINKHGFHTCPNNLVRRLKPNCLFFVLRLLSLSCQKTIHSIHLSSVIDYADIIYRTAASTSLHKLDVLYHSMLHCIYKCSIFCSSWMTLFHGKLVFIRQFLGISIYQ